MFKRVNKFTYTAIAAALLAVLLIISPICGGAPFARAATSAYSAALADLQKDSSFNVADYPPDESDYSLKVIQIAESTDGELLIYVYRPSGTSRQLTATSINMSLSHTVDGTQIYPLQLLNSSGVFQKYLVKGVSVFAEEIRYYNISTIYRPWDTAIDGSAGSESPNVEKAFPVGKLFVAKTENGEAQYYGKTQKTVEIRNPYAGFIRYPEGFFLWAESCDSHYIAFSTDWQIDELYEADVYFIPVAVHYSYANLTGAEGYDRTEQTPDQVTLLSEREQSSGKWGFGSITHKWKEIQSVSDFKASERDNLSDEAKNRLDNKQWVLRFTVTDYTKTNRGIGGAAGYDEYYTEMKKVTVLRLKFQVAGVTYNLGTVSNKIDEDKKPSNGGSGCNCLSVLPWWAWLLIVLFAPVAIVIVIKFLIWLVKLPFKAKKKRKENNSNGTKKKKKPRKSKKA